MTGIICPASGPLIASSRIGALARLRLYSRHFLCYFLPPLSSKGKSILKIAAIASGSNGNCYYLESAEDAVLVDAGISSKQIVERMTRLGLSLSKVRGVFISHEHSDHIRGLEVFSRKHAIPVFMTEKTYAFWGRPVRESVLNFFSPGMPVTLGSLSVHPFLKSHDAAEPCSFSVSSGQKTVAILTDIGSQCANVIDHIRRADALFLESNYDDRMLATGFYPVYLKKRIASDMGHLSNTQAARLALKHASPRLRHVFLAHLSANNNTPEIALKTFREHIEKRSDLKVEVTLTSRQREVDLVSLDG